jgi:hypothetical protein
MDVAVDGDGGLQVCRVVDRGYRDVDVGEEHRPDRVAVIEGIPSGPTADH